MGLSPAPICTILVSECYECCQPPGCAPPGGGEMTATAETEFLPAERADPEQVEQQVKNLSSNPIIDTVMRALPGMLAVLNGQRQIVTVNEEMMRMLGIEHAREALGLRPGEALNCVHADQKPGGCGTTSYCRTCGAAIAILAASESDEPREGDCVADVRKNGRVVNFQFRVHCCPIDIGGESFLLFFLRDDTAGKKRAILERTFFHDMKNILQGVISMTSMIRVSSRLTAEQMAERAERLVEQLAREMDIQRALFSEEVSYNPSFRRIDIEKLIDDVRSVLAGHPAGKERAIQVSIEEGLELTTDPALLRRVLLNMLINACEASEPSDVVKLDVSGVSDGVRFSVWNPGHIPEAIALRVFQRNFSTKDGRTRGLGTYSMKMFGESYLKGEVGFDTDSEEGTTFHVTLPA
ncbi:hypothetical protein GF402_07390 [Candidatus Fermentibacteria bacterium]|nr:hypothetical protein [Candidatus Fermentibacteria bacterium]